MKLDCVLSSFSLALTLSDAGYDRLLGKWDMNLRSYRRPAMP
jgi:hypothetical protein